MSQRFENVHKTRAKDWSPQLDSLSTSINVQATSSTCFSRIDRATREISLRRPLSQVKNHIRCVRDERWWKRDEAKSARNCLSPFWIHHFLEFSFELVLIVEVNERYDSAVKLLDLIEVVLERRCVADAQHRHRLVNRVFNAALAAVRYVENDFRMSWEWRRTKKNVKVRWWFAWVALWFTNIAKRADANSERRLFAYSYGSSWCHRSNFNWSDGGKSLIWLNWNFFAIFFFECTAWVLKTEAKSSCGKAYVDVLMTSFRNNFNKWPSK